MATSLSVEPTKYLPLVFEALANYFKVSYSRVHTALVDLSRLTRDYGALEMVMEEALAVNSEPKGDSGRRIPKAIKDFSSALQEVRSNALAADIAARLSKPGTNEALIASLGTCLPGKTFSIGDSANATGFIQSQLPMMTQVASGCLGADFSIVRKVDQWISQLNTAGGPEYTGRFLKVLGQMCLLDSALGGAHFSETLPRSLLSLLVSEDRSDLIDYMDNLAKQYSELAGLGGAEVLKALPAFVLGEASRVHNLLQSWQGLQEQRGFNRVPEILLSSPPEYRDALLTAISSDSRILELHRLITKQGISRAEYAYFLCNHAPFTVSSDTNARTLFEITYELAANQSLNRTPAAAFLVRNGVYLALSSYAAEGLELLRANPEAPRILNACAAAAEGDDDARVTLLLRLGRESRDAPEVSQALKKIPALSNEQVAELLALQTSMLPRLRKLPLGEPASGAAPMKPATRAKHDWRELLIKNIKSRFSGETAEQAGAMVTKALHTLGPDHAARIREVWSRHDGSDLVVPFCGHVLEFGVDTAASNEGFRRLLADGELFAAYLNVLAASNQEATDSLRAILNGTSGNVYRSLREWLLERQDQQSQQPSKAASRAAHRIQLPAEVQSRTFRRVYVCGGEFRDLRRQQLERAGQHLNLEIRDVFTPISADDQFGKSDLVIELTGWTTTLQRRVIANAEKAGTCVIRTHQQAIEPLAELLGQVKGQS